MSHDFNYRIGGAAIDTYADAVRLFEGTAGVRADQLEIAYRHGVYVASRHWTAARLMRLDTAIKGDTPSAIYTSLQGLQGLLLGGVKTLTRDDPVQGDLQCEVLISDPVEQPEGTGRFMWTWPLWQLRGYWEDATLGSDSDTGLTTTGTIGPISVGGNHPTEPKFTITCQSAGSNPKLAVAATGDELSLPTSFSTSDVIVIDVPNRTVTLNGNRAKNLLDINRGYWMEWDSGSITVDWTATSGTWDVTTNWRDRWR